MGSIREVWGFPLRTAERRRDVLVGGLLFGLVPLVGWVANLGHRWRVMERLYVDDGPWFRGFRPFGGTMVRGLGVVLMGVAYLGPGLLLLAVAFAVTSGAIAFLLAGLGVAAMLLAFHAFPVAMYRFASSRDRRWLWGHRRAFVEACGHGRPYVRAWVLTWSAIAISVAPAAVALVLWSTFDDAMWLLVGVPSWVLSPWAWLSLAYGFWSVIVPHIREYERRACERGEHAWRA